MKTGNVLLSWLLVICTVLFILLCALFFNNCSHLNNWYKDTVLGPGNIKADCRHVALISAMVAKENKMVYEIWVGYTKGRPHAQTRILFDDDWRWVSYDSSGYVVWITIDEVAWKPKKRLSLQEAWKRWTR